MLRKDILCEDIIIIVDYNGNIKRAVKTFNMQHYAFIVDLLESLLGKYNNDEPLSWIYNELSENLSKEYINSILSELFGVDDNDNINYPDSIEEIKIVSDLGCFNVIAQERN